MEKSDTQCTSHTRWVMQKTENRKKNREKKSSVKFQRTWFPPASFHGESSTSLEKPKQASNLLRRQYKSKIDKNRLLRQLTENSAQQRKRVEAPSVNTARTMMRNGASAQLCSARPAKCPHSTPGGQFATLPVHRRLPTANPSTLLTVAVAVGYRCRQKARRQQKDRVQIKVFDTIFDSPPPECTRGGHLRLPNISREYTLSKIGPCCWK